ncbi:MAG: AAA family ATPase [Planctomycetota bacterium]
MILRKIILENFRQIYGKQEISFALPGPRNVTVILGQNGAGKTTLLNSFLWCLYDKLDMENADEIVCHKAVQEVAIGDKVATEVTLVLQDGPKSFTVKRRVTYRKLDGGKVDEVGSPEFRVDVMDEKGVSAPAGDPKQLVQQMLPVDLCRFFFFRGEDMEALAAQRSAKELKDGVAEFLNFTMLDRAIKDLERVGKGFEDELRANAVGDMKRITEEIAALEEERLDSLSRLETERKNVQAQEAQKDETEKQLAESEEARPILERKIELVSQKTSLEKAEEEHRRGLAALLSRDGYLWKTDDVLRVPVKLSDEAIQRGEIPAKIKPKFVDDLLESGKCVCGRPLDADAKGHLITWRGMTGLVQHEEAINALRNAIVRLQSRRERVRSDGVTLRTEWAKTKESIRKAVEEISALDSDLEGKDFKIDEIRATQTRLRKLNDDLRQRAADVARAEDALNEIDLKLDGLRADRDRLAKVNEKTGIFQRRFAATRKVIAALTKMREGWLGIVQQYLDGQLKRNWERVAQLDRLVEVTPEFRLGIKERGPDSNWITSAPSSANRRALALCFVSALIKLASDIRTEMKKKQDETKRLQMFQGGEYPLVMDAPFAHMDKHFKQSVPAGLREVVPQVIILSNSDQWGGDVEGVLHGAVGQAYILELHIPGGEEAGASVSFGGKNLDYVVGEQDATTDWSVIREVTHER